MHGETLKFKYLYALSSNIETLQEIAEIHVRKTNISFIMSVCPTE